MGYREQFIDVDLSDLGDGLYIKLRNPMLVPDNQMPPPPVETDDRVEMLRRAEQHGRASLGVLVVDWKLWDPMVTDRDEPLPLPKDDPSVMDRNPPAVLMRLLHARAEAQKKQIAIITAVMDKVEKNGQHDPLLAVGTRSPN